ncbi:MAG: plasmid pRiA4b ORF-3 family protein [Cyanobacteriota/Melainabacteria group bacterium]
MDENSPHALNEEDYTLFDFNLKKGSKFLYEYDFGDGWLHEIVVEEVIEDSMEDAEIVAGRRACPPEDCGGIRRYSWMVEVLKHPDHPQYEEVCCELPDKFDPAKFRL